MMPALMDARAVAELTCRGGMSSLGSRNLRRSLPIADLAAAVVLALALSGGARAADLGAPSLAANTVAAKDAACGAVWLVSTRGVACGIDSDAAQSQIRFWQLEDACHWRPAARDEFLHAPDATLPTTLFVHGNRTDRAEAIGEGWSIYRRLCRLSAGRPFRLVIWSWPSERIEARNRVDLQVKAARSDYEARLLASVLRDYPQETPLDLIGYSYGARVLTGALHRIGGGDARCALPGGRRRGVTNAVLVAAGIEAQVLCGRHCLAPLAADRILVTRNGDDPVLRWYPRLYGRGGPQALGYAGPACCVSGNIRVIDVTCIVGRHHDWQYYAPAIPAHALGFESESIRDVLSSVDAAAPAERRPRASRPVWASN